MKPKDDLAIAKWMVDHKGKEERLFFDAAIAFAQLFSPNNPDSLHLALRYSDDIDRLWPYALRLLLVCLRDGAEGPLFDDKTEQLEGAVIERLLTYQPAARAHFLSHFEKYLAKLEVDHLTWLKDNTEENLDEFIAGAPTLDFSTQGGDRTQASGEETMERAIDDFYELWRRLEEKMKPSYYNDYVRRNDQKAIIQQFLGSFEVPSNEVQKWLDLKKPRACALAVAAWRHGHGESYLEKALSSVFQQAFVDSSAELRKQYSFLSLTEDLLARAARLRKAVLG